MPRQTARQGQSLPGRGNPLARRIGKRLRELRKERDWKQRELAAQMGISPSRLNKYETGAHVPPLRTLLRFAQLFDVPLDALVPPEPAEGGPAGAPDMLQLAEEAQRLPWRERQAFGVLLAALVRSLGRPPALGADVPSHDSRRS